MNFNNMIKTFGNKKVDTENFAMINFQLFLWFCYDINKFFFTESAKEISNNEVTEIFFENEFNEKVFKIVHKVLFASDRINIIEVIGNYKNIYSDIISNTVLYNTSVFKDFVFNFFSNFEKFSVSFKFSVKIFLIYIFETNQVNYFLNKNLIFIFY